MSQPLLLRQKSRLSLLLIQPEPSSLSCLNSTHWLTLSMFHSEEPFSNFCTIYVSNMPSEFHSFHSVRVGCFNQLSPRRTERNSKPMGLTGKVSYLVCIIIILLADMASCPAATQLCGSKH